MEAVNLARFYASRPARAALIAVILTAATATVAGVATIFFRPSSPDAGALPVTGSEVVLQVGVLAAVFVAAWLAVMLSGALRRRTPESASHGVGTPGL